MKECSSTGRAPVSKTGGCGFDACHSCQIIYKKNMKFNPAKYLREVRQEVSKVTWPSKRETFTSAGIVLVVISIAAIILMLLDQFFSFIVRIVLG